MVSFSFPLSFEDIAAVDSEDVLEKENGERRLESRFAGEYMEDLDMSFPFSFSSSAVGVSAGVVISLALGVFSDAVAEVDANEAVLLSGVSMLILIDQISKSNTRQLSHIETNLVSD